MTLVVLGADAAVARAAATLPVDVVHVRLPGAAPLDAPAAAHHAADYQHGPTFRAFVDEVLRPLAPAAVVSLTELGLEPAAVAARCLGAVGVPPEVVRVTRDKLEMRRVLERAAPHLNPPFAAGDDAEAVARLFGGGAPVVAKPVAGTGSNAVALLRSADDLPEDRRNRATLLERYVGGREFSVETLSSGGRHAFLGIAEKRTEGEAFVEVAHLMPPPSLDAAGRRRVERAVAELLDAVGLADGPAHTEVKVDAARVTVVETHTRPGGDGIPDLVRLTRGVDWRRAALGWPIGEGPREEPGGAAAAAAATVFVTAPPGRVTAVAPRPDPAGWRLLRWEVPVEPGDPVAPLRSSADRLGMAVLTADGARACAAAVDELRSRRTVTTDGGPGGP
ncbi:ATP-grasp domain-containing protein [Streptomyces sudanensis]|uniref:ATP-grasp domain-containing protein n=1 Tax=Streptomyces sudanensis TaxID=436397 RepID=UPI0020CC3C90|nr:ATP-grasp domain-containing protein [Streptomyces sudanensis]MCP9958386.1 ATP-grasp domain-containing protein [Streptomyces sudanensis]